MSNSVEENVRQSLVQFMQQLSSGNRQNDQNWGWNMTSDPCNDNWVGVACDSQLQTVQKIVLHEFNFSGSLDASSLCMVNSLVVLSLRKNNIVNIIPEAIGKCKSLTHLNLRENRLSGFIPEGLSQLRSLTRLDISNNQLSGKIPEFNFTKLQEFNVSNNNLTGPIPDQGMFPADSFYGNPQLCGKPLNACPLSIAPAPSPVAEAPESYKSKILMALFALSILIII
ncbi:probable inactive receptor kinase At2g26730 [Ricinus communis]|uniref:Serine-threonine protein kinase, plant-type, putative n=1 Tax=Ricinus communis TaxID=3988 RepID=B9RXH9_RICCO|nr:probable inactive receptor kinase At2g26730 [Ricinus communis]EEF43835.1 serine-threonine protein kinase, plant-type, putative [Ricinus communis]